MNTDLVAGLMWLAFAALVLLYFSAMPLMRWATRRRGGEKR